MKPELITALTKLIAILGNVSLTDALTWIEVEANAEQLLREIGEKEQEINEKS